MSLVADEEALRSFDGTPDAEKKVTPALRGVLAEIATTGIIRYEWTLLQPLVTYLLSQVLLDYDSISKVEVGPMPPPANGESIEQLVERLTEAVRAHSSAAPFTLQRLAELLLEPQKQYSRLDKLALALEKLLLVTSTVASQSSPPPRPALNSLPPVNENPKPPPGSSSAKPPASIPGTANGPHERMHMPGSGFNLASAALGTLSAGAAPQYLPNSQSPAMAADIDRLGDSAQPVVVPAAGTSLITENSLSTLAPGVDSQAPVSDVLQNGSIAVEPDQPKQEAAEAPPALYRDVNPSAKSEPDIR